MKYYKTFYEIGNNRYSTINVDDEMYIATESFIKLKKRLFRKQQEITQGMKLLKFTPEITMLFLACLDAKEKGNKKDTPDEFKMYAKINNKKLKESIVKSYKEVYNSAYSNLENWKKEMIQQYGSKDNCGAVKSILSQYEHYKKELDSKSAIPTNISFNELNTLNLDNIEHLYNEQVSSFSQNEFYYEQDCFNTITVYRLYTVKGVVKSISTFTYDRKLINTLMETMYKEGR